ncbi:hypothetical protein [uncultured Brevundimonas sp.]|uniref:hypothetical protein n=1 Tax=uncultured Brevundimonas sp. TaxID=213418 RepID=UPI0030EF3387|tara:strand:+ start:14711 stop:14926 length:216 start_codon:yes stop_codon:yes gene_type:complete
MAIKRSGVGPVVMTILSIVVIAQTAALAWLLLVSPDRAQVQADLKRDPVPTLVNMCTAAFPKSPGKDSYKF